MRTKLLSMLLVLVTVLSLLPTSALAASSTGTGIKPTSNTNYWTTRLLHDGTPYSYVETGKLTAAISEVDEVVAQEVVNLTPKKRTLFGTLFASMLRSFWTALTVPGQKAEVLDAEFVPAQEDHTETVQNEGSAEFSASDQSVPEVEEKQEDVVDEELNRIVGLFKLSREQGYTLKLIPGTPEENAPVFDFENERILRPAA